MSKRKDSPPTLDEIFEQLFGPPTPEEIEERRIADAEWKEHKAAMKAGDKALQTLDKIIRSAPGRPKPRKPPTERREP